MASQYRNDILKISVAEICQTIGFQGICSTPLEVLSDLLHRYMTEVSRLTHRYTEHFGRTEPNLDDLGLAFNDMGISVSELEEFVNNVDCPSFPTKLPSIPVQRSSNLNFLKPGSREILSRPIHIHEHLPPMYPEKEGEYEEELEMKANTSLDDAMGESLSPLPSPQSGAIKRSSDGESSPSKKQKYSLLEEEGQPHREIESVMMTTSGFISSAKEGKLPEPRAPDIPMSIARSSSPSLASSAAGRKKLAVEKLIRQKNNQGPSGGGMPKLPFKAKAIKDKSNPKIKAIKDGIKIPKLPKIPKIPKIPGIGPGSNAPPPPGTMISTPKVPPMLVSQSGSTPGTPLAPPKLKMPTPKVKIPKPPKTPKSETKKPPTPKTPKTPKAPKPPKPPKPPKIPKSPKEPKIKIPKVPKTPKTPKTPKAPKAPRTPKDPNKETKKQKKEKEPKKPKEKKEKESSSKKSREGKKDKESKKEKESKKDKEAKKESKKEKEREKELIRALTASTAVTVTSIPAPTKSQEDTSPQDKGEGKSKLSIFKRINKSKADLKDMDRGDVVPSRDSSPDLMIDESPSSKMGHRRAPHPPTEDFGIHDSVVRRLELPLDNLARSPGDFYPEDLSPPRTPSAAPRTPEIPNLPIRLPQEKRTKKEKAKEKKPRKDRSKSPRSGYSPAQRDLSVDLDHPPERPKTPEVGLPLDDMGGSSDVPFSLPPFPNHPSFLPPFSRFPFMHPFPGGTQRPGLVPPVLPDLRLGSPFINRPSKRPIEDDHLSFYDPDGLERPLTPRHDRDSSPLPAPSHSSPLRSPSPAHLLETPPRPRTPAHHSPPPIPKLKMEKVEKEKKKEHKKEKKEKEKEKKEKEKEKGKKKKDKKDKDKEKEPEKKKKEKPEKKEKKRGRKGKEESTNTAAKLQPPPTPSPPRPPPHEVTPKLVIKPVIKRAEESSPPKSSSSGSRDDQPGSPEIAKFSALITRPPRNQQKKGESPPVVPPLKIKEVQQSFAKQKDPNKETANQSKSKEVKEVPPLKIKNIGSSLKVPATPKAVVEDKKSAGPKKSREKKEKKEKPAKDTGKVIAPSAASVPSTPAPSSSSRVEVAPPIPSTPTPPSVPQSSPEQPKSKKQEQQSTGLLTETVGPIGHFVDDQGNEVWICPTCGKQDDGSPMIGCDTCDDWYHWVCVGIQVCPNEESNWYCPRCVSQHKQRGAPPEKKKRGRKKKNP